MAASSSTMAAKAAVVMMLFLACALDRAWTPAGAARMVQRGEVAVVVANGGGGGEGNNGAQQQWKEFTGPRPRTAVFKRRDAVAPPSSSSDETDVHGDREVPSGPDPIHHGGSPSSASP
ncbi:hypothetical protein E2562_007810 [Oryza meyeriana var. granulata]|uniref:Uncharacterized protein n=1 Tax=Oryza meyeriana var. granulata TaxID=110450 RepID=A0A6G1F519_9ORYZ|nr:hypothetical protein E2562_007810 [Oryza meyeriana var. granulata]